MPRPSNRSHRHPAVRSCDSSSSPRKSTMSSERHWSGKRVSSIWGNNRGGRHLIARATFVDGTPFRRAALAGQRRPPAFGGGIRRPNGEGQGQDNGEALPSTPHLCCGAAPVRPSPPPPSTPSL